MRKCFKDTILKLAENDPELVMLMGDISVFLFREFYEKYPDRFFNAGIAENTEVSMAAAMSLEGFHPFVHTIAPFVTERSYEQIKLDLCYNGGAASIVSCGGSFDYAWDGATHHCYTDLELMRMLPRMEVMQPGSNREFAELLSARYAAGNPTYIRIAGDVHGFDLPVEFGKGVVIRRTPGAKLTVATAGPILKNVAAACAELPVNLIYFHTLKPIDAELVAEFSRVPVLVVHDAFGLAEAIAPIAAGRVAYHGIPDRFCGFYGELDEIRGLLGLDPAGIRQRIEAELGKGF